VGELWLRGNVLVGHELPRAAAIGGGGKGELAERFAAYFAGEPSSFDDVELDLDDWTPFQCRLVGALRSVPYGETVTYGELAALAGSPSAHRAAGTFCAGNRFPLVVPCHRVVAANGIGGFGPLGVDYKRRLLELERTGLAGLDTCRAFVTESSKRTSGAPGGGGIPSPRCRTRSSWPSPSPRRADI
jgi:O-6-methylguanine DNA methyltransferase